MVQRCAPHCAQCEAEKGRASQKQRSEFLAAPVHKALRAGKRANAYFACSEGFFCVRRAAPCAGLAVLARLAAVVAAFARGVCLPSVRLCMRVFHLSFAFSCLAVASQTSFHLSLRPRREFPCLFLSATLFPACGPLTSFCPTRAAGTCPPCALCAQFCFVSAVCLPVLRCLHAHFSLIFRLFLFGFCLSKFFSLVAQAATGLYFLPKRK